LVFFSRELFPISDEEQQSIENDSSTITNDIEQGMKNMYDNKNFNNGHINGIKNEINIDDFI
jgi:hypothetical protein